MYLMRKNSTSPEWICSCLMSFTSNPEEIGRNSITKLGIQLSDVLVYDDSIVEMQDA